MLTLGEASAFPKTFMDDLWKILNEWACDHCPTLLHSPALEMLQEEIRRMISLEYRRHIRELLKVRERLLNESPN